MAWLGRIVSNVREFYNEINSATLTGAIDVVAIEGPDGEISASPFHVRFGKASVLHSREKVVDIAVNGLDVEVQMKLGEGGEAFFVDELPDDESDLPAKLATSPIPSSMEVMRAGVHSLRKQKKDRSKSRSSSIAPAALSDDDVSHLRTHPHSLASHRQRSRRRRRAREMRKEETEGGLLRRRAKSWSSHPDPIPYESLPDSARKPSNTSTNQRSSRKRSSQAKQRSSRAEEKDEVFAFDDLETSGTQTENSNSTSVFFHTGADDEEDVLSEEEIPPEPRPVAHSLPSRDGFVVGFRERDLAHQHQPYPRYSGFHPFSDTDLTPCGSRDASRERDVETLAAACKSDSELNRLGKDLTLEGLECAEEGAEWKWGELPDSTPTQESQNFLASSASQAVTQTETEDASSAGWGISNVLGLGHFMRQTRKVRHKPESEGIYLDDLIEKDKMDPKLASLYFPASRRQSLGQAQLQHKASQSGEGAESDPSEATTPVAPEPAIPAALANPETAASAAPAPPDHGYSSSPGSVAGDPPKILFDQARLQELITDLAMSTCGGIVSPDDAESLARFEAGMISYERMNSQPSLLFDPELVVRIRGQYYAGRVAMPMLVSVVAFQRPLSESALAALGESQAEAESEEAAVALGTSAEEPLSGAEAREESGSGGGGGGGGGSWFYWGRAASADPPQTPPTQSSEPSQNRALSSSDGSQENLNFDTRRYKKVLRLTSSQLKSLGLRRGQNEVRFSVTTRMQGTAFCTCHLYLWRWTDRIVISDIDGTITKSDVFGQILPQFGNQWAQAGVAQLYNRIANNGYQILYLSARAIGQASSTKGYLRYVKQDEFSLPDGPLLLSPSSLLAAFQREVIEKKPEVFKKAALSDIAALFPASINPFYAGFGNKVNDVVAYQAAKVPISKIFTINHRGELRHELVKGMTSSYCELSDEFVDLYFPPMSSPQHQEKKKTSREEEHPSVTRSTFPLPEEFSAYTFWRSDTQHDDLPLDKFPPP